MIGKNIASRDTPEPLPETDIERYLNVVNGHYYTACNLAARLENLSTRFYGAESGDGCDDNGENVVPSLHKRMQVSEEQLLSLADRLEHVIQRLEKAI